MMKGKMMVWMMVRMTGVKVKMMMMVMMMMVMKGAEMKMVRKIMWVVGREPSRTGGVRMLSDLPGSVGLGIWRPLEEGRRLSGRWGTVHSGRGICVWRCLTQRSRPRRAGRTPSPRPPPPGRREGRRRGPRGGEW